MVKTAEKEVRIKMLKLFWIIAYGIDNQQPRVYANEVFYTGSVESALKQMAEYHPGQKRLTDVQYKIMELSLQTEIPKASPQAEEDPNKFQQPRHYRKRNKTKRDTR